VNADSGIERPEDLAGKTVGEFALYGSDPGVWMKAVDTFLRYHHEQGLSKRLLTFEDIFVPALLGAH
jgi:hypothetical protein